MLTKILNNIGYIFSLIYPYTFHRKIKQIIGHIYTGWRYRKFRQFGKNSKFGYNMHICGEDMIEVSDSVYFGDNGALTAFRSNTKTDNAIKIKIGNRCVFGKSNHLTSVNKIEIGEGLRTGKDVLISDNSHGDPNDIDHLKMHPDDRPIFSRGPIVIGTNVWIGEKAVILAGVTIGDSAIIGANAVVTRDVPARAIAVGVPARIIQKVFK